MIRHILILLYPDQAYISFATTVLGGAVTKKTVVKIAAKDADQYMLRLPPGLRDRVARRATENGRSMNTEIIDAIEKHLMGADRVTRLWEFFEQHREDVETIPLVRAAVENLEIFAARSGDDFQGGLRALRQHKEREAREAARPPITADQATKIRALLETPALEARFLRALNVSSVEEIRDFDRAINLLEQRRRLKEDPPA
jgi:hypothetical protein